MDDKIAFSLPFYWYNIAILLVQHYHSTDTIEVEFNNELGSDA